MVMGFSQGIKLETEFGTLPSLPSHAGNLLTTCLKWINLTLRGGRLVAPWGGPIRCKVS